MHNPLDTFFGSDRESELEAIDQCFMQEVQYRYFRRLGKNIRVALGVRGRGWMVRCWSYAERH